MRCKSFFTAVRWEVGKGSLVQDPGLGSSGVLEGLEKRFITPNTETNHHHQRDPQSFF